MNYQYINTNVFCTLAMLTFALQSSKTICLSPNTESPLTRFERGQLSLECPRPCDVIVSLLGKREITWELVCAIHCEENEACTFYKFVTHQHCYLCTDTAIKHRGPLQTMDTYSFVHQHWGEYIWRRASRPQGGGCDHANDCSVWRSEGYLGSGMYPLTLESGLTYPVYCDMTTDNKGWTVFQRRRDGTVNFFRRWSEYKVGFGDLAGEFWLGNDALSQLTQQGDYELRIDMGENDTPTMFAVYDRFSVDGSDDYRLTLGSYSGTAGDSMGDTTQDIDGVANNQMFSTWDYGAGSSCAQAFSGAWWYNNCYYANLNGIWNSSSWDRGINWRSSSSSISLKFTEMKMRLLPETAAENVDYQVDDPVYYQQDPQIDDPVYYQQDRQIDAPVYYQHDPQIDDPVYYQQDPQIDDPVYYQQDHQFDDPVYYQQDHQINDPVYYQQDRQFDDPVYYQQDPQIDDPVYYQQDPQIDDPVYYQQDPQIDDPVYYQQDHQIDDPVYYQQDPQIDHPVYYELDPPVDYQVDPEVDPQVNTPILPTLP